NVVVECRSAYANYEFRKVFNQINQFCATELSALYIDITKDRMYCDAPDSTRRLAAQTVMQQVFDAVCKLMAPVLAFTADEAWEHAGNEGSVHEQDFPEPNPDFNELTATTVVNELLNLRAVIQTAIEEQVQAKTFNKNNEASVTLTLPADHICRDVLADEEFATEFFIVSEVNLLTGDAVLATASATPHGMCPRCRRYLALSTDVCSRCDSVS
ncbi:MAG: class I tRNA ligase family protein, partial [Akkermansiaceae bacterium]